MPKMGRICGSLAYLAAGKGITIQTVTYKKQKSKIYTKNVVESIDFLA